MFTFDTMPLLNLPHNMKQEWRSRNFESVHTLYRVFKRVSRNNTLNTLEHTEHARNTPQNFCKKMKQKQHARNTPQIFSKILMPIDTKWNTVGSNSAAAQKFCKYQMCVFIWLTYVVYKTYAPRHYLTPLCSGL